MSIFITLKITKMKGEPKFVQREADKKITLENENGVYKSPSFKFKS
jgi:hypothetical protein